MSRFVSDREGKRTLQYERVVREIRRLLEFEGDLDKCYRAFAEAVSEEVESTWREYFKPTKARVSFEDFGVDADWHFAMPGDDHVTQWRKKENGGLRWVSQPYYLELGDLKKMVDHAEKHDLFVRIDPRFSWHFPGYTMQVVWRKRL